MSSGTPNVNRTVTPPALRFGHLGIEQARKVLDRIGDQFPPFFIAGQKNAADRTRVVLWELSRQANGGEHFPTLAQQRGSCVGHGKCNAEWYLMAVERLRLGEPEAVVMPYEPYGYGCSRVQVGGGRLRGDGSLGVWAADAARKFGVLRSDTAGLPPWETREGRHGATVVFPGDVDKRWGDKPGPPTEYLDAGREHLVRSTALVTTYPQVRDALANGYPVTVASNRGFRMRPAVDKGKHWGKPAGSWAHQMCLIGIDDDSRRPGVYCLNSWGPDAHGPPADDAPPGGFWIDADVCDAMVRQGDSWAFSQFDGFPEQDLDFNVL